MMYDPILELNDSPDYIYPCGRRRHLWKTPGEAARCCRGWVRVIVPVRYDARAPGDSQICRFLSPEAWLWKPYLVREDDTDEIQRVLAVVPFQFLSSTQDNHWLTVRQ